MTEAKGQNGFDVLAILKDASGRYVSGECLSRQLGITRAAVWKRIAALKQEGYKIEASTRKGYRLSADCMPYGRSSIQSGLKTELLGRELHFFREIDSTNTYLKQIAAQGAVEGTVAVADFQSAGRGRLGRSWSSSPGLGIWMSVLLRPGLHPAEVQILTLAASVAVCRALAFLGLKDLGIKWPNDILAGGKKVCGILTELSAEAERVAWVVIGIGLNVNHQQEDFPAELLPTATSLRLAANEEAPLDRSQLAIAILNALEQIYKSFLKDGPAPVAEEWKKWSLTLGKRVRLISSDKSETVEVLDLSSDGRLTVKQDDGAIKQVLSGEISLREIAAPCMKQG